MLELRPNCEGCDIDLPVDATNAYICTYECTFCKDCVEQLLKNVCPNCGGGFTPRPVRPVTSRRTGVGLAFQPASTTRVNTKYGEEDIHAFSHLHQHIPPQDR